MLAAVFAGVTFTVGLFGIVFPLTLIVLSYSRGPWRALARAVCAATARSALFSCAIGMSLGAARCLAGEWGVGVADGVIGLLYLWVWWLGGGSGWFKKKAERVAGIVKETVAGRLTVAPAPSPA